ncbi:MAG: DUF1559 family PulG-like putative transporter [Pirellulaceae bacterium]
MVDDKPNSESLEESIQGPIDPDRAAEAIKAVNEAMAILPRRRFGCLGRFAKIGAVLLVLLAVFVYWNFLRTPRLTISKETTYITQPLTSDGTRVDYFAALEQDCYPPEMKTDDNGYRLIVRALGDAPENRENETSGDAEARTVQVYEKLGLDPAIKPTMTYIETHDFLREYGTRQGLDEKQTNDLEARANEPWTLADLPMMGPWLEKNGPVIDLVGEAVRKSTFRFPLVRPHEDSILLEMVVLGEMQRTRSFARMIQTRVHYRIGMGDIDGAIYDVITGKRLARHVQCQGTLIARLVGIAVEGIADTLGLAANRKSQPTEEQLQRFVAELNSLPPRPDIDRMMLAERYLTLDWLQAVAHGDKTFTSLFPPELFLHIKKIEALGLGVATRSSVDWNIVMRQINGQFDDLDTIETVQRPQLFSLDNLFLGGRSRRLADLFVLLTMPGISATREADYRSNCGNNLHRIMLAMLMYQHEHGTLPPAYTVNADGKPLHSWRVLLLPYLGQQELYGKLRLDEPWDSEHNRPLQDAAPAIYQCPSAKLQSNQTTYSVIVGEHTAFGAGTGKSLNDFGMNLLLVVEREQSVCWMDPSSELTESIALEGINRREDNVDGIGSPHPGGLNVGLRNGSVRYISEMIESLSLQTLLEGTATKYVD